MSAETARTNTEKYAPPQVSVVIPSYNADRFVIEAVNSVLNQTWSNLECIVVDDGSTDSTAEIIRMIDDPRLRYLYKLNEKTPAATRNAGMLASNGNFIAFLDADDVWLPTKLEAQMRLFKENPELGIAFCGYAITDAELHPLSVIIPEHRDDLFLRSILLEGNGIAAGSTLVIRRVVFDACRGFRTELSVSEDTEFAARAADSFAADGVDSCLVLYRSHPAQNHANLDLFEHDSLWILHDRFKSPSDTARLRRGLANMHTRLFFYRLRNGDGLASLHHLRKALINGPTRVALLPFEGLRRRIKRSHRSTVFRKARALEAVGAQNRTAGSAVDSPLSNPNRSSGHNF